MEADTLGNFLPIFQKKLINPTSTKATSGMQKTAGFDYSKKSDTHKSRATKLQHKTDNLKQNEDINSYANQQGEDEAALAELDDIEI